MADVVYPNTGLIWMLEQIANDGPGMLWHLYGNPAIIGPGVVLANLTSLDALFPPINVPIASFGPGQVVANVGSIQAPLIGFLNLSGAPATVWGYYVTDSTGVILVQVSQFDGAPLIVPANGTVPVAPIVGGYSGNQT